jgi:perosamine synthetase
MFKDSVEYIKSLYSDKDFVPLHEPIFNGNEKKYLSNCIDSGFVSSVGEYVNLFEEELARYTGAKKAVLLVNGTQALHLASVLAGVNSEHEVLVQPLTFIATVNAISYTGAAPVFIDVDKDTMGMSPTSLKRFLEEEALVKDGCCFNKKTLKQIKACIPMHTFGHPARIDQIKDICDSYNITLIEDAAESIGSSYKGKTTGLFGELGVISFNGNKVITTGGGGAIITNNEELAAKAKYLSTQAKIPHPWEYEHDQIGYNYRMPNINAALGLAQLENLDSMIQNKRQLAENYKAFFQSIEEIQFFTEPHDACSNYWLNAVIMEDRKMRDDFLTFTNENGVMTRPIWKLAHHLPMYSHFQRTELTNAEWLADRVVNIPSSCIQFK